jgi:hypothetical protein
VLDGSAGIKQVLLPAGGFRSPNMGGNHRPAAGP